MNNQIIRILFKNIDNAEKNVSAIKEKEKKQTWFHGKNGFR